MADSLTEIRKLRDQRELIDVVFEVEGKEKVAHKIFLVAVSKYCKAQFLGHWGRQLERGATVTVEDVTFNTLSAMVDFAYTEEFVAPLLKDQTNNNEIADALDDMLDLLKGTDMWFLDRLHDVVEDFLLSPSISANWIRVDNVVEVTGHAHQAGAARLEKHCEDFILANKEIVEAVAASDDE